MTTEAKAKGVFTSKLKLRKQNCKFLHCDLDAWSRNPSNNFKFKNCLFGATSIVKNSDKENWVYTFDSVVSWNFAIDFI